MKPDESKNFEEQSQEASYAWSPEQMLETIMKGQETIEDNWVEEGLPKLVDKIIENYVKHGGINHLEGKDLPSKASSNRSFRRPS